MPPIAREEEARVERPKRCIDPVGVRVVGGDGDVDVARRTGEAAKLERDTADEHEADLVLDEDSPERDVADVGRAGHASSSRSSRGLRDE